MSNPSTSVMVGFQPSTSTSTLKPDTPKMEKGKSAGELMKEGMMDLDQVLWEIRPDYCWRLIIADKVYKSRDPSTNRKPYGIFKKVYTDVANLLGIEVAALKSTIKEAGVQYHIKEFEKYQAKWGVDPPIPSIPVMTTTDKCPNKDELLFGLKPKFERTGAAFEFNQDNSEYGKDPNAKAQINVDNVIAPTDPQDAFTCGKVRSKPLVVSDVIDDCVLDAKMEASLKQKLMGTAKHQCSGNKKVFYNKQKKKRESQWSMIEQAGRKKSKVEESLLRKFVPVHKRRLKAMATDQKRFVKVLKKAGLFCKEQLGNGYKLDRMEWTQYCNTEFHVFMCAILSAGVKDWQLLKAMDLLRALNILDIDWMTTAGSEQERLEYLEKLLNYAGYNYFNRASVLIAASKFVKEAGYIPNDPEELLQCYGVAEKTGALICQDCLMVPLSLVCDTHLTTVFGHKGLTFSKHIKASQVADDVMKWLSPQLYKQCNEVICGLRIMWNEPPKPDYKEFFLASAELYFDPSELKMLMNIIQY